MDPEMVQLLAQMLSQAKGGNRNVGSVAGNLDNPILLALAGVLDPYYGQGGSSGTIYDQFAADESTPPAVLAVMDYVDQGMNPYQIEAQINNLDPAVVKDSGYTDEQLISMGKEMSTQRGKKQGSDVFKKAGLRNPNEIYNIEDVPLDAEQEKSFGEFLGKARESEKGMGDIEYRIRALQQQANKLRQSSESVEVPDWYPKGGEGPSVKPTGAKGVGIQPGGAKGEQLQPTGAKGTALQPTGAKGQQLQPMGGAGDKGSKKKSKIVDIPQGGDISRAIAERSDLDTIIKGDLARAQAIKQGALNRAAASGKTPFTDQASSLLRFIAGSK